MQSRSVSEQRILAVTARKWVRVPCKEAATSQSLISHRLTEQGQLTSAGEPAAGSVLGTGFLQGLASFGNPAVPFHCSALSPSPETCSVSDVHLAVCPTVPVSSGVPAVMLLGCCTPLMRAGQPGVVFGGSRLSSASRLAEPHGGMGQTPGQGSAATASACAGTAKVITGTRTAASRGEV